MAVEAHHHHLLHTTGGPQKQLGWETCDVAPSPCYYGGGGLDVGKQAQQQLRRLPAMMGQAADASDSGVTFGCAQAQEVVSRKRTKSAAELPQLLGLGVAAHLQQQLVDVDSIVQQHVSASLPACDFSLRRPGDEDADSDLTHICMILSTDGQDVGGADGAASLPRAAGGGRRGGLGGEAAARQGRGDGARRPAQLGAGGAREEPVGGGAGVARPGAVQRGRRQRAPRRAAARALRPGATRPRRLGGGGGRRRVVLLRRQRSRWRGGGRYPSRAASVCGVRPGQGGGAAPAVPPPVRVRGVRCRRASVPGVRVRQERQRLRQLFVRIRVQVGVETGRIVLIRVEVFLSLFFFPFPLLS
jgi:hypothetical protein